MAPAKLDPSVLQVPNRPGAPTKGPPDPYRGHPSPASSSSPARLKTPRTSSWRAPKASVSDDRRASTTTSYPSRRAIGRSASRSRRLDRFRITARLSSRFPTANPSRAGPSPRASNLSATARPLTNFPDKNTCSKSARRRNGSIALLASPRRPSGGSGPSDAAPSALPVPNARTSAGESRGRGGVGDGAVGTFFLATRLLPSAH